jgi:hypothetical protein
MRTIAVAMTLMALVVGAGAQHTPIWFFHADMDAWNRDFPGSAMAEVWNDPQMQQWRSTSLEEFFTIAQRETGVDFRTLIPHIGGEMAIVFAQRPVTETNYTYIEDVLAVGFRQDGGRLDRTLAAFGAGMTPQAQQEMQEVMLRQGDVVVFGEDPAVCQQLATAMQSGGTAGLGYSVPAGTLASWRLEMANLLQVQRSANRLRHDEDLMLQLFGVGNMQALTITTGFANRGLMSEANATFNGSRAGLLSLVETPADFSPILQMMPAQSLAAVGLATPPPEEVFQWMNQWFQTNLDSGDREDLQHFAQEFQTETGMPLNEALAALGQRWGLVVGSGGGLGADLALIAEVRDPQPVGQFFGWVFQQITQESGATPVAMNAQGVTYSAIPLPGMPIQMAAGLIDDHLVVATSPQMFDAVLAADRGGASLLTSPGMAAVGPQLDAQAAGFVMSDRQLLAAALTPLVQLLGSMAGDTPPPQVMQILSRVSALAPRLGFQGATLTADSTQMRLRSVNTSGGEALLFGMCMVEVILMEERR